MQQSSHHGKLWWLLCLRGAPTFFLYDREEGLQSFQ